MSGLKIKDYFYTIKMSYHKLEIIDDEDSDDIVDDEIEFDVETDHFLIRPTIYNPDIDNQHCFELMYNESIILVGSEQSIIEYLENFMSYNNVLRIEAKSPQQSIFTSNPYFTSIEHGSEFNHTQKTAYHYCKRMGEIHSEIHEVDHEDDICPLEALLRRFKHWLRYTNFYNLYKIPQYDYMMRSLKEKGFHKCPITLEDYKREDKITKLTCKHILKRSALLKMKKEHGSYTCPCCRKLTHHVIFYTLNISLDLEEIENIVDFNFSE